jgi:hypothetical protein
VNLGIENRVRFMLKAGGHSPWSTIGKDGIVKELGTLKVISVDREAMSVTIQGRP